MYWIKNSKLVFICLTLIFFVTVFGCTTRDIVEDQEHIPEFIKIMPNKVTMSPYEDKKFFAWGVANDGYEVILPSVTWYADNGSITSEGLFSAPENADVVIISAAYGNLRNIITVEIKKNEIGTKLIIKKDVESNLTVGFRYKFSAYLVLETGGEIPVKPVWDAGIGKIDTDGSYLAPVRAGLDSIKANYREYAAVLPIELKPAGPMLIWVKPSVVEIAVNESINFETFGIDKYNNIFPMGASFSTDSGRVTSDGTYFPDSNTVTAKVFAQAGYISGNAEVNIKR